MPEESKSLATNLQRALYRDNCVTSVDTVEERNTFRCQSTQLLAQVKLELRLWEDNVVESGEAEIEPTMVLGLMWDKGNDTLCCPAKVEVPTVVTKRSILATAQKVFDPMGFLSPALLLPKLLLQVGHCRQGGMRNSQKISGLGLCIGRRS